jgi:hypothetical protein
MKDRMEKQALTEIIRFCFHNGDTKKLQSLLTRCDIGVLIDLTARSGLGGFIYSACKQQDDGLLLPKRYLAGVLPLVGIISIQNGLIERKLSDIADAFRERGLSFFVLKGIPLVKRLYDDEGIGIRHRRWSL